MGSENSIGFRDNSLLSFNEESVNYDGIKTTEGSSIGEEDIFSKIHELQSNPEKNRISITDKISTDKVPVTFEWDQGGNSVYVTGNFCHWEQFFLMKKNSNGNYFYTINLTKGLIEYKFKVDGEWKCNEKFPITNNNGNRNNYIDTTNWEISFETNYENNKTNTNTNSSHEISSKPKFNKSFNTQNNYSNYIPKMEEMNEFGEIIPELYKPKINLNRIGKQNNIENNIYLSNYKGDSFEENNSYKIIKNLRHEQINHLNYKIKNINKITTNTSMICRYRLKFTCFVYYK